MSERCEQCGGAQLDAAAASKKADPWASVSNMCYILGAAAGAILGLLAYVNYWL